MRTVSFVTNRPAISGGFGPPPPCGAQEVLTWGRVAVAASADPGVVGTLAGPLQLGGTVACSVPGPDLALVAALQGWLVEAGQQGRTPIVCVHGFSYSFTDAVRRTGDACAWLEGGEFPVELAPILFTWPSVDGLSPQNYLDDRGRAQASANALARFVVAFARAWDGAGRPRTHYLAHSMGTWATQNGMRMLAAGLGAQLEAQLGGPVFEHALIMGGDADVTALEPGQGLDQLARLSQWLTVGVNRTDFATGVTSADILKRPRLGSSGPASVARIPDNARIVDYTLAVAADRWPTPPGETDWNYRLHQYYRTNRAVREDIAAMLSGGDPDELENRFTSAQMTKAGQASIKPGRLYLCPPAAAAPAVPDQDNPDRR